MSAFEVVEMFEDKLAEYTGAPYAVAVDSCTNALLLCFMLRYMQRRSGGNTLFIPRRTYVGVAQAAHTARWHIQWTDNEWEGEYKIAPIAVWDSAKVLAPNMYHENTLQCVSFHIAKRLPLGRGGAILLDDPIERGILYKMRLDGRMPGESGEKPSAILQPGFHCYMTPPDAARALWLLDVLDSPLHDSYRYYPDLSKLLED